eukprot:TRINITY_DN1105_c0_g1_i1.p2 TRINITY_DN1105_c0_g1~~TRINITY_DN1105_c0_g1_i1.p2  ORF type:complete len:113 (-),score=33.69 TRINITY_DN1105_c0_g1_i1:94-432(-)
MRRRAMTEEEKKQEREDKRYDSNLKKMKKIIGRWVKVYFPQFHNYSYGMIVAYYEGRKQHGIIFEDEDDQSEDMLITLYGRGRERRWEFVERNSEDTKMLLIKIKREEEFES